MMGFKSILGQHTSCVCVTILLPGTEEVNWCDDYDADLILAKESVQAPTVLQIHTTYIVEIKNKNYYLDKYRHTIEVFIT